MLLLEDRRAKALKGYELRYPIVLTTLADFLACGHHIWPICVRGCGWRPPLYLPELIERHGQDYPFTALVRNLRCKICGGPAEVRITAESIGQQ